MDKITFDYSNAMPFIEEDKLEDMIKRSIIAKKTLLDRTGKGNEFLGWLDLPENYDKEELVKIKKTVQKIKNTSKVFLVIGIGGSYLGAKAAITFLNHSFYNQTCDENPEIYFVGNNVSTKYVSDLISIIKDKDFSINIISKSGTTTEPMIAFAIFKKILEDKYGKKEAAKRIFVTTDREKGTLKKLADKEHYETFVIKDDIGGRFSVLTAVGLLPIAVSGANIDKIMEGARYARNNMINNSFDNNEAMQYAVVRNLLYNNDKSIEIFASYEPSLYFTSEWWKQLYGESEGKEHKGIFPALALFTADLHSVGQFIQDGSRNMFETIISIENDSKEIMMDSVQYDLTDLNYLDGKSLSYINKSIMESTIAAHVEGGVPNLKFNIPRQDEFNLGQLFYLFEFACGISGYLLGINPFNQPGVEVYKSKMFKLLK